MIENSGGAGTLNLRYHSSGLDFYDDTTRLGRITGDGYMAPAGRRIVFGVGANDYLAHDNTGGHFEFFTDNNRSARLVRQTSTKATLLVEQTADATPDSNDALIASYDDPDSGLYMHGTNQIGLMAGGNGSLVATSTGVAINNSTASVGGGTATYAVLEEVSVNGVTMLAIRKGSTYP